MQGYKIVNETLRIQPPRIDLDVQRKTEIVTELFPRDVEEWERTTVVAETWEPIRLEELSAAASRLKNKKAPGPDGVPPEATKVLVK